MNKQKAIVLALCLSLTSPALQADQIITMSADQINNLGIKIEPLQQAHSVPILRAPAEVIVPPSQEHIVSAPQSALIVSLNVAVGDTVKKHQILAKINSPALLTLQRNFLKASSERRLAHASHVRDKTLYDEGIIAKRRWQETQARYDLYVTEVSETRQLLKMAGMSEKDIHDLAQNRRLQDVINIRAPISGVVLERMVVSGQRIDALSPLYRIANLDELWLEIHVPQERIKDIKLGDRVMVNGSPLAAHITLLGLSVDPNNQTVLARAVIEGRQPGIRAGQIVNTQIIRLDNNVAFRVPDSAISRMAGKSYIFIRVAQGFKPQLVNILGKERQHALVQSDLQGNETLATEGTVSLKATWTGLGGSE